MEHIYIEHNYGASNMHDAGLPTLSLSAKINNSEESQPVLLHYVSKYSKTFSIFSMKLWNVIISANVIIIS